MKGKQQFAGTKIPTGKIAAQRRAQEGEYDKVLKKSMALLWKRAVKYIEDDTIPDFAAPWQKRREAQREAELRHRLLE